MYGKWVWVAWECVGQMMTWFCSDQLWSIGARTQGCVDTARFSQSTQPLQCGIPVWLPYDQYVSSVTVCDSVLFSVRTWPSAVGFPDSLVCLSVTMCHEFGSLHQKPHWQTLHNFGMSIREDCWKVYTVYLFWHCSFQKSCSNSKIFKRLSLWSFSMPQGLSRVASALTS